MSKHYCPTVIFGSHVDEHAETSVKVPVSIHGFCDIHVLGEDVDLAVRVVLKTSNYFLITPPVRGRELTPPHALSAIEAQIELDPALI